MSIEVSASRTVDLQNGRDLSSSLSDERSSYSKPVLNFDSAIPNSPLQARWRQIQDEIEAGINQGRYVRGKYFLIGHNGEPIVKNRRRGRKPQFINSADYTYVKRPPEYIAYEEAGDVRRVIAQFVSLGDSVCKVLGSYEVTAISSLLGRVGPEGSVYYVTSAHNLRVRLFQNLFDLFVNFREIKGESNAVSFRRGKLPSSWAEDVTRLLAVPFLTGTELYQDRYTDQKGQLAEAFYQKYPLVPINHQVPPFPSEIGSESVDAIMELDRLSGIPTDKRETLVLEMDHLLKPGGVLLIRENALSQTEIQYYGEDIFTRNYTWEEAARLEHPNRWMLLRKNFPGTNYISNWVPNGHIEAAKSSQACKKDHSWEPRSETETEDKYSKRLYFALKHMLTKEHKINGETFDPQAIDERLKEQLSLRWFKNVGLLAPLLTDFGGSVDKAVDFVVLHSKPNQGQDDEEKRFVEYDVKVQEELDPVQPTPKATKAPKNTKPFYTIKDVSKELAVPTRIVRDVLNDIGVRRAKSQWRLTPGNVSSQKKVPMHFTYVEYQLVKEIIQEQTKNSLVKDGDKK